MREIVTFRVNHSGLQVGPESKHREFNDRSYDIADHLKRYSDANFQIYLLTSLESISQETVKAFRNGTIVLDEVDAFCLPKPKKDLLKFALSSGVKIYSIAGFEGEDIASTICEILNESGLFKWFGANVRILVQYDMRQESFMKNLAFECRFEFEPGWGL